MSVFLYWMLVFAGCDGDTDNHEDHEEPEATDDAHDKEGSVVLSEEAMASARIEITPAASGSPGQRLDR